MGHAKRKPVFVTFKLPVIHTPACLASRLARIFKISNVAVLAFKLSYIYTNIQGTTIMLIVWHGCTG